MPSRIFLLSPMPGTSIMQQELKPCPTNKLRYTTYIGKANALEAGILPQKSVI